MNATFKDAANAYFEHMNTAEIIARSILMLGLLADKMSIKRTITIVETFKRNLLHGINANNTIFLLGYPEEKRVN